jgi:predicted nuclease with TOPRIM domain
MKEVESSKEDLVSQITDSNYEVQQLKDEISLLEEENSLLKDDYYVQTPEKAIHVLKSEHSPEIQPPPDKVMRSTVAEEPDYMAQDFVPEPLLFPGVVCVCHIICYLL